MTNFEKWKDEILKIKHEDYEVAVKDGVPKPCVGICNQCEFEGGNPCIANFVDWLLAEYKEPEPKLTKREREFIETFWVTDKAIKRDRLLYLCCKTYKGEFQFSIKEKLFPFIKQGETWTFTDLMKLEVKE